MLLENYAGRREMKLTEKQNAILLAVSSLVVSTIGVGFSFISSASHNDGGLLLSGMICGVGLSMWAIAISRYAELDRRENELNSQSSNKE